MADHAAYELTYEVPASVSQVTSAIDDLKQSGAEGFANFHKIGPTEYRCSESLWVGPLEELDQEVEVLEENEESDQALLSTVISILVVAKSRKKPHETAVIEAHVEKWIGNWTSGGAASLDRGSTVVSIHERLDPMVSLVNDRVNQLKARRDLGLD